MALTTPIALERTAFDANKTEALFKFNSIGGNQVVKNRLTIRDNDNNNVIYENTINSFQFQQSVLVDTLTNGKYYNFYFNTYDISNNISENSNSISFYCLTTPTLNFTNIPSNNIINSSSYTFKVKYDQEQKELLNGIIIYLYDDTKLEIKNSGIILENGQPPNIVSYTFSGLEDKKTYHIKAIATTVNGMVVETEDILFNVIYDIPMIQGTLIVTNYCDNGYNKIYYDSQAIEGESLPKIPQYLGSSKLYMTRANQYVKWSDNIEIPSNFILEIWYSPSSLGEIYRMYNETGDVIKITYGREIPYNITTPKDYLLLEVVDYNNIVKVRKKVFNELLTNNSNVAIWVKKVNNDWEFSFNVLSTENSVLNWNDTSNIVYERITDLQYNEETYKNERITDLQYNEETYKKGTSFSEISNDVSSIFPITNIKISNGIFNHINITSDITKEYSQIIPTQWDDEYTLFDCNFNKNISGGKVKIDLQDLKYIKIKRREKDSLNWITIKAINVNKSQDLDINMNDSFIKNNTQYEYAIVPTYIDGTEGNYLTSLVISYINGVFLSNQHNIFKLYNGVSYDSMVQNKPIGKFEPFNRKYPILVSNGNIDYKDFSISGDLYGYNYESTKKINRESIIKQADDLSKFLNQGGSFILSDWNGRILLLHLSQNQLFSFVSNYGNGIIKISIETTEQGDATNQNDLYNNGLVNYLD